MRWCCSECGTGVCAHLASVLQLWDFWEWRAFNTCGWAHGKYSREGHSPAGGEDWDAEDEWQLGDEDCWWQGSDWMDAEQGHAGSARE